MTPRITSDDDPGPPRSIFGIEHGGKRVEPNIFDVSMALSGIENEYHASTCTTAEHVTDACHSTRWWKPDGWNVLIEASNACREEHHCGTCATSWATLEEAAAIVRDLWERKQKEAKS
jgi:hypothetical protein